MIARLACSRDFQAFRESSDSGQWPEWREKRRRKEVEKRREGLFSPNPHLPPAVFSCSLFFAPSSQSERLEQAIVRLKNSK